MKIAQDWKTVAAEMKIEGRAFIDGEYVDARSGKTFLATNPATGQGIAEVASCDVEDVELAVKSARKAFQSGEWSNLPPRERKRILLRFGELLSAHSDELAVLESVNIGKPIANCISADIPGAIDCIQWYSEAIDKVYGEVGPSSPDVVTLVTREPLGVVAAVVPWNYPLLMAAWKLGPALAVGNSVILKPAEQSPLSAIRIASLAVQAGIPPGVLNVLPGFGNTAGRALGLHGDVDCVTFTGSTEVGKLFMQYSGQSNIKRVSLECGGKSPQIVLADADLDAAAKGVAMGIFYDQGQVCNAGSRLIVEETIREELLEKVVRIARNLKIGDPLDPQTELGAIVSREQLDRIERYIGIGQSEGARVIAGGRRIEQEGGGYFVEPTVFDGVSNGMRIAREEIFGPVLSTIAVKDLAEAVEVANHTDFGLAAAIWTRDLSKAHGAAKALRAGVVWVNCFDRGNMWAPFGGFKQSGFGRDKSLHAMEKYTDLKAVWIAH